MKGSSSARRFVIFLHACIYTPAQIPGRWQWLGVVQRWQGQERSGHGRVLRKDQLSSACCYSTRLLAGKSTSTYTKILHGKLNKKNKESLVVLVANILTSISSFPIKSYKRSKTECGSSSEQFERGSPQWSAWAMVSVEPSEPRSQTREILEFL